MVYRADERPQSRCAVYLRNSREAMRDDKESRRRGGADHGNRQDAGRRRLEALLRASRDATAARLQPNFLATL